MTAQTWSSLQTNVAAALVQGQSPWLIQPPDFVTLFPQATSYAEGKITRDLVLLNTRAQQGGTTGAGQPNFSLAGLTAPGGLSLPVVVVEGIDLTVAGQKYAYEKASLDTINLVWPAAAVTLAPNLADWSGRYWAMLNDATILLAPTPDAAYPLTCTGLFVPTSISATNTSTYISTNYGDLMFAAVMVWMSGGLLRNYGAGADESPQAVSWMRIYDDLLPGCQAEELRRRGLTPDIQRPAPAPVARG